MSHMSLFDALLDLITSSTKTLQRELEKAGLHEPWLDRPQLHPWDIETPTKEYWDARRTLLSSLGTMVALVQNPRERILCEGMGYHHPAVQNFVAHTRIADILAGPDVDEAIGLHVTELARRINTHPAKLGTCLGILWTAVITEETSPNVFANNRASSCLKSGSPNADVPFYWSDISFRAATAFSRNLRNPATAFSERVQDSAFSAVFGAVRPEYHAKGMGEMGDFEMVGLHLDRDVSLDSQNISYPPPIEAQCCNELGSDFEHIPNYLSSNAASSEFPPVSSQISPSSLEEDSSEEEFSPLSFLSKFPLTPDSYVSFPIESPAQDVRCDTFTFLDVNTQNEHKINNDLGTIMTKLVTESLAELGSPSDYFTSSGVTDSGIFLPTTTGKSTASQDSPDLGRQEDTQQNILPVTVVVRKEPETFSDEVTTAFSFLSYPQCGLYRKAFAQGMFTLEIMNGALGYNDINWKQWDKKDNMFVELGASTGHLSLSVLPCLNHAQFINQDLPEVCQEGVKFFLEKNPEALHSGRVTFQPHDFFTPQPVKGAAIYILSNILHDWPDKEALDILGNIAEAMTAESRLLVCEIVHTPAISQSLKPPNSKFVKETIKEKKDETDADISFTEAPWPLLKDYGIVNRYSHHQTIELMLLFNGLDRTLAEYSQLFRQKNLELVKIHRIRKLVSVMELKLRNS